MIYLWSAAVMSAAGYVVYRTLAMANAMSSETRHGIRAAVLLLSVSALGEVLALFAGRVPEIAEGAALIGIAVYFAADRRRADLSRRAMGGRNG